MRCANAQGTSVTITNVVARQEREAENNIGPPGEG
jgi:hypothetical protein